MPQFVHPFIKKKKKKKKLLASSWQVGPDWAFWFKVISYFILPLWIKNHFGISWTIIKFNRIPTCKCPDGMHH